MCRRNYLSLNDIFLISGLQECIEAWTSCWSVWPELKMKRFMVRPEECERIYEAKILMLGESLVTHFNTGILILH